MAKAKRGKSGSSTETARWETELIQASFNDDKWKPMVVVLAPSYHYDKLIITLVSDAIQSGLRKLFSVVDYEALLSEVKEIATQNKGGKGKPSGGKQHRFSEVCDQVKKVLEQNETISPQLLAKLIKFKLLTIKSKDLDRREQENKSLLTSSNSKHKPDSRSQSKNTASPRGKSQSPGKGGKKGAKKEEKPPSPKKDTKLKKRGEESESFKTIDDEPDGAEDPKHYIVLTGFTEPSLLNYLNEMNVMVNTIINLKTDYLMKHQDTIENSEEECSDESDEQKALLQSQLDIFWHDSALIVKQVPTGHPLRNTAKFDLIVKEDCLPEQPFDLLEQEKKVEFRTWLFDKVADVCFDTLDYQQQYNRYLANLKVIDVSSDSISEVKSGSEAGESPVKPPSPDLRYYRKLMSKIPVESESVPLIMDCLLEQVVAITDGPNPMDVPPPAREDGLSHLVGEYLDKRLAFHGMQSSCQNTASTKAKRGSKPELLYYKDKFKSALLNFNEDDDKMKAADVYARMQKINNYSNYVNYLCPTQDEWIESCIRRRQLYQFCCMGNEISEEIFEQAMRQFIFESLPLETAAESGNIVEPDTIEEQLEKIVSCWDHPYCDMQNNSSQQDVEKNTTENAALQVFRNLTHYCWLERFEPGILFQILDAAAEIRPFLDTYYNRGNNTMLMVLHNPSNKNLQNNTNWDAWLHSNVGFRNYLEHVAYEIEDWTNEAERLEEEKTKQEAPQEPMEPSPVPPPIKERSRWSLKTRAEILEEEHERKEAEKSKKSPRSKSSSPKKSKSPEKKKSENKRRTPSAKKSRLTTSGKRPGSTKSGASFQTQSPPLSQPEKEYDFTGYNLGDNLLSVSGDLSYLFPQNKSLIKIERFQYVQANTSVMVSVMKRGDLFTVNFVNPLFTENEDKEGDVIQEVVKSNLTMETSENDEMEKSSKPESMSGEIETVSKPESTSGEIESEFSLPSLPEIPQPCCMYSNINATFSDGMILSLSSSVKTTNDKLVDKMLSMSKEPSEVSKEPSQSTAHPKSPKGKRTKKDEDAKAQEEADRLLREQENERKLQKRRQEIIKILKDNEGCKNLFVTTPGGLHVSILHSVHWVDDDSCGKTWVLKQEQFVNKLDEDTLEQREIVKELYRCITENGWLMKYMSDETIEIFTPAGDVFRSSPYVKPSCSEDLIASSKETSSSRPNSKKHGKQLKQPVDESATVKSSPSVVENIVAEFDAEWRVTLSSGKQKIIKSDGEEESLGDLLVWSATCFDTNQVLLTREDGVITIEKPDGSKIVEYLDGTRFTSFTQQTKERQFNAETGEEEAVHKTVQLVKIEHDCMASVLINESVPSMTISFGNKKQIKCFKNGGYIISKNENVEMIIDKHGKSSLHPKHNFDITSDGSIELPASELIPEEHCVIKESSKQCLDLMDGEGNKFVVHASGNFTVDKKPEGHDQKTIPPRYFVVYPDGSGEELLQYDDIAEYLQGAELDPSTAVLKTGIEGDDEGNAVTVMKPHKGPPSKVWRKKKDGANIIPLSLRERDFKSFPAREMKKPGPPFGTKKEMPAKVLPKKAPTCPALLEIRHLVQYKELTQEIREQIIDGISRYGEFVQQQQESDAALLKIDERSDDEKLCAEDIQKKYLANEKITSDENFAMSAEEILAKKYIDTVTPPSPEPVPTAKPQRSEAEWERDSIELAELKHAKSVIRKQEFPPYFDTEEGQRFLYENGILPDMEKLTSDLAYETVHPVKDDSPISTTTLTRSQISSMESSAGTPVAASTPQFEDSSYSMQSSWSSMKYDTSGNTISPHVSSLDGRPLGPTPKQASNMTSSFDGVQASEENTKLQTIPELLTNRSTRSEPATTALRSLTYDVSGSLRRDLVKTPTSILGSKPNAIVNKRFQTVEESVRRQIKTASVSGAVDHDITSKLRGFVLLPDLVDFGILSEGLTYAFSVTMKNVGVDSCRFKIKQPPPSTGMKVIYKPGPVAAGMSVTFDIEIFALAVGVEGSCGIGQVSHHIEITTETEILFLPVIATIITQEEFEHPSEQGPRGGPSKGTSILGQRPSSRESLTRPRRE